jgi:predicted branched-subunit amino acid permease
MFWDRTLRAQPSYREGVRDFLPQLPGITAWGLMTGVTMVKSGLSGVEAVAMALMVYAGSSQLASLPLIAAGAPVWVVLATGFCVNLRFVVFSLHMREFVMHLPRWRRLAMGYYFTDNTYVLFTRRHPHVSPQAEARAAQEAYLSGLSGANWLSWMSSTLVGIALANFIPPEWGLGFAGILCLLGVQCSLASSRLRILAAGVAAVVAVAVYALPFRLNIVLAIGAAVMAGILAENLHRQLQE